MTDFPIEIKIQFTGSLWNYWEQQFSQDLEALWQEMQTYRTRAQDYAYSELARRESFISAKERIRALWKPILEHHTLDLQTNPKFPKQVYYSAIYWWFKNKLSTKYGGDIMNTCDPLRHAFDIQHINNEQEQLEDLIDDERLEELWNRFGSHKLPRVKFVWATA